MLSLLNKFKEIKYHKLIKVAKDLYDQNKIREALDAYYEAFKVLINLADYVVVACIHIDLCEYDKAIEIFNNILDKVEDDPTRDLSDIYYGLGVCYDSKRMIDKALVNYELAIKNDVKHADCYYFCANIYDEKELDEDSIETQKAILYYKKAIELDDKCLFAYINLANIYSRIDKDDDAFPYFLKARELDKDNKTNSAYNLGVAYSSKGDFEKARDAYLDELKCENPYKATYYNLGVLYKDHQEYEIAKQYYLKAIEQDKEEYNAWYNLACVYALLNDFDNAFSCLTYVKYNMNSYLETTKEDTDLVELRKDKRYDELMENINM